MFIMVSYPLLIALLTLIDVTRSFEYFIDLERCKTEEMTCHVRSSCFEPPYNGKSDKLRRFEGGKLKKNDTCDVIVQIKAFAKEKYHILIQVNISASESALDELDTTTGISIIHVETQVKCSSNGIDGKLVKEKYGSRQLSTKTIIFCSAILAVPTDNPYNKKPIMPVFEVKPYHNIAPALEIAYLNREKDVLQYTVIGYSFWSVNVKCSDELLHTSNKENDEYLLSEIDVAPAVLSCPEHQQIFVDYPREELVMNSAVWCDGKEWVYKKNGTDIEVDVGQPFAVYCAIKFSELCTPSALLIKDCRDCSPPTPIGNDTFKCDGNKSRMSDGSVEETEVNCKQVGNERTSAWQTNEGKFITEGTCSADFDCATFNKLNFTVPEKDNVHVYKAVDQIGDGNRLNCSEGFNLAYISSDGATNIIDEVLVCEIENGFFNPEGHSKKQDKQTNNTSSVFCAKGQIAPPEKDPQTGALSPVVLGASIGGGIVAVLISMCIIGLFLRVRYLKRKAHEYNHERELQEMETAKEINTAKEMIVVDKRNQWTLENLRNEQRIRAIVAERLMEEMRVRRLSGN